jgi:DNA-binding NarL/FixJ family response regulator
MNESNGHPRRVFIVDDHPIVRQGLGQLINHEPDLRVCGEAAGVREARASLGEAKPDVVIVDLSLRDSDGLELIKDIRSKYGRKADGIRGARRELEGRYREKHFTRSA